MTGGKKLLFFDAPDWVFTVCYTLFGSLVLLTWYFVTPRFSSRDEP